MALSIETIRRLFKQKYADKDFRGNGTIEVIGSSILIPDTPERVSIFGEPNEDYISAEIQWYNECNKSVDRLAEIYGKRVAIWDSIADSRREVNSNYGWCIYSTERGCQYYYALSALRNNDLTRQATMIYQDPQMHRIAGKDFTCTNAVHYYLRPHDLWDDHYYIDTVVQMRSNDVVYGFNNDYAWQQSVVRQLCHDLYWGSGETGHNTAEPMNVVPGDMIWQASSLHIYERHYHLMEA